MKISQLILFCGDLHNVILAQMMPQYSDLQVDISDPAIFVR